MRVRPCVRALFRWFPGRRACGRAQCVNDRAGSCGASEVPLLFRVLSCDLLLDHAPDLHAADEAWLVSTRVAKWRGKEEGEGQRMQTTYPLVRLLWVLRRRSVLWHVWGVQEAHHAVDGGGRRSAADAEVSPAASCLVSQVLRES